MSGNVIILMSKNRKVSSEATPALTVFYDGACPLCMREIGFYRRRAGASAIDWVDVSAVSGADPAPGLSSCEALARFHVRDGEGRLYSGARAFAMLWEALPSFRWAGQIAQWPPVLWILERGYRLFLKVRPALQKVVQRRAPAP